MDEDNGMPCGDEPDEDEVIEENQRRFWGSLWRDIRDGVPFGQGESGV